MRSKHGQVRLSIVVTVVIAAVGVGAVYAAGQPGNAGASLYDPTCIARQNVCNPAAEATDVAMTREAQPPSAHPVYLSRQEVEVRARRAALTPLTPAAPSTAVVYSALMTRPQYEALSGDSPNYAMNRERAVWIVTVHAPMATDGRARVATVKPVYSIAFDAETGHWTDMCIGCAWLSHSQ